MNTQVIQESGVDSSGGITADDVFKLLAQINSEAPSAMSRSVWGSE